MLPWLLPHDGLVLPQATSHSGGLDDEAVVGAGDHLRLAAHNAYQLQLRSSSLVVLRHCEESDLLHVRIGQVLDRSPTSDDGLIPDSGLRGRGGESGGKEDGGEEEDEGEEEDGSHVDLAYVFMRIGSWIRS
ncbi:hypothetical protein HPP92_024151 [Vanilla planifolia]|uniref:Uncharacterized protein n=1 Tax=Vanilla planifolia TaxID=51239 RepID=A0A835PPC6_VANPL|nr:hypothetical protein HPP92_024484 [Vanilla planifolia]KAG0456363.1 hypothetical protein HPP92_024151 [Vanilla planifolia]